jgi:hypothetical protein
MPTRTENSAVSRAKRGVGGFEQSSYRIRFCEIKSSSVRDTARCCYVISRLFRRGFG